MELQTMNILKFPSKTSHKPSQTPLANKPLFPEPESYGHYLDKRDTSFALGQQFAKTLLGVFALTEHLWQQTTFLYGFVSLLPLDWLMKINHQIGNEITYRKITEKRKAGL